MEKVIWANTHAEFLNQVFGTNYKGWGSSRWVYNRDTWVWMVKFDGKIRDGWVNQIVSDKEVHENYVWYDEPSFSKEIEKPYRIVVAIFEASMGRKYCILGKYKYDSAKSSAKKHVFLKIEDV